MSETRKVSQFVGYLLAATPFLKKQSKFERMYKCSCPFIIEKGLFIKWMATTGKKRKFQVFERNTIHLE